jgi:hypothetical protein
MNSVEERAAAQQEQTLFMFTKRSVGVNRDCSLLNIIIIIMHCRSNQLKMQSLFRKHKAIFGKVFFAFSNNIF